MKKLIVIVIVIAVAGVMVYLYRPRPVNDNGGQLSPTPEETSPIVSPTATPTPAMEVIILYTADGFQPASVTVKAGTKVTFQNASGGLMWPASAVHPTHLILPEFNAKTGIADGGTYSFTFTQTGTWRFHNHLKPNFTGSVVVE